MKLPASRQTEIIERVASEIWEERNAILVEHGGRPTPFLQAGDASQALMRRYAKRSLNAAHTLGLLKEAAK